MSFDAAFTDPRHRNAGRSTNTRGFAQVAMALLVTKGSPPSPRTWRRNPPILRTLPSKGFED